MTKSEYYALPAPTRVAVLAKLWTKVAAIHKVLSRLDSNHVGTIGACSCIDTIIGQLDEPDYPNWLRKAVLEYWGAKSPLEGM